MIRFLWPILLLYHIQFIGLQMISKVTDACLSDNYFNQERLVMIYASFHYIEVVLIQIGIVQLLPLHINLPFQQFFKKVFFFKARDLVLMFTLNLNSLMRFFQFNCFLKNTEECNRTELVTKLLKLRVFKHLVCESR